jgi:hypothetical protein
MASKIFTSLVVAFWLVMMAALVRLELFPSATQLKSIPTSQVLRKLFENYESQNLKVLYQGQEIGHSTIEIIPLASPGAQPREPFQNEPGGYQVKASISLDLNVIGTPSRFQLKTDSRFNSRYDLQTYRVRTTVGASSVEIDGTNATRNLTMTYDIGDGPHRKSLDYAQLTGPNALEALGLPALSGLASIALPIGAAEANGQERSWQPVIRAYEDSLSIGGIRQQAYLVECRSEENPAYWLKMWIDDQGGVMIVETSLGMILRSTAIDNVADRIVGTTVPTKTRRLQ